MNLSFFDEVQTAGSNLKEKIKERLESVIQIWGGSDSREVQIQNIWYQNNQIYFVNAYFKKKISHSAMTFSSLSVIFHC